MTAARNEKMAVVSALVVSFLLARVPGAMLYIFPPIAASRFVEDGKRTFYLAGMGCLAVLPDLIRFRSAFGTPEGAVSLLISVFIPLALCTAALIWVGAKSLSVEKRYIASILPGSVALLALVWYLSGDSAVVTSMREAFADGFALLQKQFAGEENAMEARKVKELFTMMVEVTKAVIVPFFMFIAGLNEFLALMISRRDDSSFSESCTRWYLPLDTVWLLLTFWAGVVVLHFLSPHGLAMLMLLNLAGAVTLLYGIQGFSILLAFIRRKHESYTVGKLFWLMMILFFLMPGVNIVVVVGLPLLGVSETWIKYRKK